MYNIQKMVWNCISMLKKADNGDVETSISRFSFVTIWLNEKYICMPHHAENMNSRLQTRSMLKTVFNVKRCLFDINMCKKSDALTRV